MVVSSSAIAATGSKLMTPAKHNTLICLLKNSTAWLPVLMPGLKSGGHPICSKRCLISIGTEIVSPVGGCVNPV
jgi:hypothetical protein